jgi:hypothetical protein
MKVCRRGHELVEGNLCYNSERFRCCRKCKNEIRNRTRKDRRAALRWLGLIVKVGERRINAYA